MAVRKAHQQRVASPAPVAGAPSTAELRTHRPVVSRRAHRAAHAQAMKIRRNWMCLGVVALAIPFAGALTIVELVH